MKGHKHKLELVDAAIEPLSLDDARAAREAAEVAFRAATENVDAIVDRWQGPMRDRRILEGRRISIKLPSGTDADPHAKQRQDLRDFDDARHAEDRAKVVVELARKTEAQLQEAADREAFGDGRADLRQAIADAAATKSAADKARSAVERARTSLGQAEARLGDAATAVETARASHVAFLVSETDELHAGRNDVRAARRDHADAVDDMEVAKQALAELQAAAEDAVYQEGRGREWLEAAARAVLAVDVEKNLDELDAMFHDFKCRMFCRAYFTAAAAPRSFQYGSSEATMRMRSDLFVSELERFGKPIATGTNKYPSGRQLFDETLAALMVDARAPLPVLP